ncbi:hypothetical protein LOD99_5285 [Oopsacas minuta]|uniref:DOCKER domain-containing protein n=1 Tax=Oopsacas minuta TaxID=111878 RepID=A0AAV7JS01_9METZ|nr:hypothetical protein LOD99_5285 [Oopsacas minuta]
MDRKRECLLGYFSSNATSSQSPNPEFNLNIDGNDTTMQETLLVDPGSLSNQDSSYTAEDLCGQEILNTIVSEIKKIGYFAILADETTDSSHQGQLCFCIRYVSEDAFIKEEYISYGAMEFVDAKSITEEILSRVTSIGLNIDNCIAQCYDGCSTMSDHISGVATRIMKHAPLAIYLHRVSHRLNLVLNDSSKLTEIRRMFDIVFVTINCINDSSGRRNVFDAQFISYCSTSFYKVNNVSRFRHSRPFHKGEKDKANEFKTLWLERTVYSTNAKFPGLLKSFPVISTEIREISPLEYALETIKTSSTELKELISSIKSGNSQFINQLSMRLNGIIEAAVMGGLKNYEDAFFTNDYLCSNPAHEDEIIELKELIREQIEVIHVNEYSVNFYHSLLKIRPDHWVNFHWTRDKREVDTF